MLKLNLLCKYPLFLFYQNPPLHLFNFLWSPPLIRPPPVYSGPNSNILSLFSIKDNPVFSNGPKSLYENSSDCPALCNCVFDNFMLDEEIFALWSFETCVLGNNNLWGKLFSSLESPTTLDESC